MCGGEVYNNAYRRCVGTGGSGGGGGHKNNAYRKYRRRESNTVTQQETNVDYRLKVMLFQFKDACDTNYVG